MPLAQSDRIKYKSLYLQAARQNIKELEDTLAQFSAGKITDEALETIHRDAHSLKGQSLMMEYTTMGELALSLENIFRVAAEKKLVLTSEMLPKITKAILALKASVDTLEKEDHEQDLSQMTVQLQTSIPIPAE
jgi:chemotaxis protein histidine kinase CheA